MSINAYYIALFLTYPLLRCDIVTRRPCRTQILASIKAAPNAHYVLVVPTLVKHHNMLSKVSVRTPERGYQSIEVKSVL